MIRKAWDLFLIAVISVVVGVAITGTAIELGRTNTAPCNCGRAR
jgi:hypothetical protein